MFGGHRLPGVAFETLVPPAPEALPRMDVALFVGFAEMGPVHRPVAIDDVAAYRRIFGGDLPLSRDPESGETIMAALAPTVRAFFSNGGSRCWVVRVARNAALEARWRDKPVGAGTADLASAGRFTLPGLLALGADGTLGLAGAQARSLGSWCDQLAVAAHAEAVPFAIGGLTVDMDLRASFTAERPPQVGTLVELSDAAGSVYARVDTVDGRNVAALCLAGFAPVAGSGTLAAATAGTVDGAETHPADFDLEAGALSFDARPEYAAPGRWLRVTHGGTDMVFQVDTVSGTSAAGRAWVAGPARAPAADAHATAIALGLRIDDGRGEISTTAGIGLTPQAPRDWWSNLTDDARPAGAAAPALLLAREDPEIVPLPLAWIPLGLDGTFSDAVKAVDEGRTALERDGLSRFDAELFLDPGLAPSRSGRIVEDAERILYVDQRPLFGIHGVFGIADGANFNLVSLIAIPDAAQPGWSRRAPDVIPPPVGKAEAPPHWFDHRGPCASIPKELAEAPAPIRSRFLDCTTRVLEPPIFEPVDSPLSPGSVELRWSSLGEGTIYRLEIASLADFQGAQLIYSGTDVSHIVQARAEGFYYFRLRAERDGEVSAPALLHFAVRGAAWDSVTPAAYSNAVLLSVQRAAMRMAAGSGEMFALLSLPRHYHAPEAIAHGRDLAAWRRGPLGDPDMFDTNERRTLSFAALHHPWIAFRDRGGAALAAAPPDGAVAGVHARRTIARGAWIAAANEPLRDIVALTPRIGDNDWPALDAGRINFLRRDARGFLLLDADTLSDEPDWRHINVRRLMSLLRRAAIRRGASYVFEPNGDVLRRAVERGFSQMLDHMFRLGAFAGRKPEEAWRVSVDPTAADREAGRLIVEIGVAPAQPMRFITVRLAQSGERFTIAEEA